MTYDLSIDTRRAADAIRTYLAETLAGEGRRGILMGLSGGLDSCVLATLAAQAAGPGRLFLAYLPDRDSAPELAARAQAMADRLSAPLEVADISDEMRRQGIYAPLFIRALRLSPLVAPASAALYRGIAGETPFKSSLRDGGGEVLRPWYKRLLFARTIAHLNHGFEARHQFRRRLLEARAEAENLMLIGAANRSEAEVGWFVKDGIDDLPRQPMTGLLKTQVRQLAAALDLPEDIRAQLPSPDMARGVSDEFGIGHDYAVVDQAIEGRDRGLGAAEIAAATGIGVPDVADILDLMALSEWKRRSPHEEPPVSGRFGSPLRVYAPRAA